MSPSMKNKIAVYAKSYVESMVKDYMYNPNYFYGNFDNCLNVAIRMSVASLGTSLIWSRPISKKENEWCKQVATEHADFLNKLYNFKSV